MAFGSRTRLVNPRLGTYFGIFTASFAALVLLALMLEQLGTADTIVRLAMFAVPIAFYGAIGGAGGAREGLDYFAAGRRVPAFFNGLVLAIATLGGAGLLALTGTLFIAGVDGLCLSIGWYSGLVFMGVLFAPFLRKFGAYTLPSFLGRRFESRGVRIVAAATLAVPILLLLAAEARFAAYAAAWMLGQSEPPMAALVVASATAIVFAGGMRSLTWSSVAKAIATLLALAVPATIVATMISNLPLPQMTHGNIVRIIMRTEILRNVPIVLAPSSALELPGRGIEPLLKRFIQTFGSVGSLSFVLMSLVMAAGVAAAPALVARSGTTPGVYEARKSLGWAVLVCGLVLLTLPAIAVYLRVLVLEQVVGQPGGNVPIWFKLLEQAGIARLESKTQTVALAGIGFERDAVLFALPIALGLPQALVYLPLAGALAAALSALASALVAAAAIVSEDVVHGLAIQPVAEASRMRTARIALVGTALVTAWLAIAAPGDPLQLFLWAVTLSASTSFPVLFLAIWWKRINSFGAVAGMVGGLAVAALVMLLSETGATTWPSPLAGAAGLPAAFAIAIAVSLATPLPSRSVLDIVRDLRVPGGETLYDREMRLLRLKSRATA
jgi:cation/acetate symporter